MSLLTHNFPVPNIPTDRRVLNCVECLAQLGAGAGRLAEVLGEIDRALMKDGENPTGCLVVEQPEVLKFLRI